MIPHPAVGLRLYGRTRRLKNACTRAALLPLATALLLAAPGPAAGQRAARPAASSAGPVARPLHLADYARWRSIQGAAISADGEWVAWTYSQLRQDDVLHVRHIDSGREHHIPGGSRPTFSGDDRRIAYFVAPEAGHLPVVPGRGAQPGTPREPDRLPVAHARFFDHYLIGAPMPPWMEHGERFIDKHRRAPVPISILPQP